MKKQSSFKSTVMTNNKENKNQHITKNNDQSWTDLKVQQIKKKYQSTSNNSQSRPSLKSTQNSYQSYNHRNRVKTEIHQTKSPLMESSRNGVAFQGKYQTGNYCKQENGWNAQESKVEKIQSFNKEPGHGFGYGHLKTFYDGIDRSRQSKNRLSFNKNSNTMNSRNRLDELSTKYGCVSRGKEYPTKSLIKQKMRHPKNDFYDPRIQNIDKINNKIKQILESIDKNQAGESQTQQIEWNHQVLDNYKNQFKNEEIRSRDSRNSILGRSALSREFKLDGFGGDKTNNEFQETKILEKQKFIYGSEEQPYRERVQTEGNYHEESSYYPKYLKKQHNQHKQIRRSYMPSDQYSRSKQTYQRSKSLLGYQSKRALNYNNQDKGSKFDSDIDKIQEKIALIEEEKKRLNINFTPFKYNRSSSRRRINTENSDICHSQLYNDSCLRSYVQRERKNYDGQRSSIEQYQKKQYPQEVNKPSQVDLYPKKFTFSNILNQESQQRTSSNGFNYEERFNYNNEELRMEIQERIKQRRKKLQFTQASRKFEGTNQLLRLMSEQVKLDQQFRNGKSWLSEFRNPQKNQLLRSELQKRNIELSHSQVLETFSLRQQENNPFFSYRQSLFTISSLVQAYIDCQHFWNSQICKSFNMNLLDQENIWQKLDFENKGYMGVSDFVRLINTNANGNLVRNRDVVALFKRISGGKQQVNKQRVWNVFDK